MATTHTFRLSEPLKTHDGEVMELKLKEPKARLIVKYDDPFSLRPMKDRDDLEYVWNQKAVMAFASDMSGVDELILSDLPVGDYMRLRQEIANIILGLVPDKNPSEQPVA
jgi:hypothetical protein